MVPFVSNMPFCSCSIRPFSSMQSLSSFRPFGFSIHHLICICPNLPPLPLIPLALLVHFAFLVPYQTATDLDSSHRQHSVGVCSSFVAVLALVLGASLT